MNVWTDRRWPSVEVQLYFKSCGIHTVVKKFIARCNKQKDHLLIGQHISDASKQATKANGPHKSSCSCYGKHVA